MSDRRDTPSSENPACACGHPMLRHVFGNGWCTIAKPPCACLGYSGPPAKPEPVEQVIVRGEDGLAVLAYVRP